MFEHLLSPEFDDLEEVAPVTLLSAQASTAAVLLHPQGSASPGATDWFTQMGSPEHVLTDSSRNAARKAFAATLSPDLSDDEKKRAILNLRVPQAVKHLAGMLSQYDWDYVEQAKELRGYVVASLLEESKAPDARIRLKAIELLGKLTEVASFSDRIEVISKPAEASDITERLRAKLQTLLPRVVEIETVESKE